MRRSRDPGNRLVRIPAPLDHIQAVQVNAERVQAVVHEIISRIGLASVPGIRYSEDFKELADAALRVFSPYQVMVKRRLIGPRSLLPRMSVRFATDHPPISLHTDVPVEEPG